MIKKNSASPHLTFVGFFFKVSLPLMDNGIMIFNFFFCLTSDFNFILKVFTHVKHLFIPNSNRYRPTLIFINCENVTIFKDQSISLLVRHITHLFDYLYPYHLLSFFQSKNYFHFDYFGRIILR